MQNVVLCILISPIGRNIKVEKLRFFLQNEKYFNSDYYPSTEIITGKLEMCTLFARFSLYLLIISMNTINSCAPTHMSITQLVCTPLVISTKAQYSTWTYWHLKHIECTKGYIYNLLHEVSHISARLITQLMCLHILHISHISELPTYISHI